ncbi:histidine phosphatase family protein [Tessaracoccus lapidicaptus]|uniref:histidine phosphatase family protein n=1 Tax=Tessaracoccus lapidicaptus TaxID=1427523 RepID=UPI003341258B
MILHLVRHGQSTWNLERRLQGQRMDVPLTTLGLSQAEAAARVLDGVPLSEVVASDQLRALQTAEVIAARHGAPLRTSALLREQALGSLEGMSYDDLTEEPVPDGLHLSEVRWGGGESVAEVHGRLSEFVAELRSHHGVGEHLAVVSHGDTLRILLAVLAGRGHRDVEWVEFGNGQVVSVPTG